ncbi:hypothetical protein [Tardiphaga sp. P5_C10]
MPLKGAQEFIEEMVRAVRPARGQAISVTERQQKNADDTNWIAGIGNMSPDVMVRYDSTVAEMRRQHPTIDWEGITEMDGERRRIARWLSEVEG